MADREKVIISLRWFRDRDKWREGIMIHDDHAEVRKQICDNAIALLKEQQQQIWELQDQVENLTDKLKEQEAEIERLKKPTAGDNKIPLKW